MRNKQFKVSFLGDVCLNGNYKELYIRKNKPFELVREQLSNTIVVGNLECFAKGDKGVNGKKKPRLETSLVTLNYLNDFDLRVACLANNHAFDQLEDGFTKTINFLEKNNIQYLGASDSGESYNRPCILEQNGVKVALLNYVDYDTNPNPPDETIIQLNFFNVDKVLLDIANIKDTVDHIVLSLHWGGKVEGGSYPDWKQPGIARKLIDGGADMIIGHHSHTVHPYEKYKNKYIFYSLGNFCFSDFVFEGKRYVQPKKRKIGIIPIITFTKTEIAVNVTSWKNNNLFLEPVSLRNNIVIFKIISRFRFIWKLYYLYFKKIEPILNYMTRNDLTFFEKIRVINVKAFIKYIIK